ncbi:MAG: rhamnogalacturonan acetylesterase, partial [Hungatella sp.]
MEILTPEIRAKEKLLSIPETSDGFDLHLETHIPGMMPITYFERVSVGGTYQIYIKLIAMEDIAELFLFAGRKQLVYVGGIQEGEVLEKTILISLSEIIPRYHVKPYRQEFLTVTWACEQPELLQPLQISVQRKEETIPVIYLAGDSTVTDQSSELPYHPGACYSSWGQDLPLYIKGGYAVDNQAHCGLTTESFRKEGHARIITSYMQAGDYCLFQFGHNDQKLSHLQAATGYRKNLIAYIEEIRNLGGNPILVTPLPRNTWNPDGTYNDLLKEHAQEVLKIATEYQVPVIDLHEAAMAEIQSRGKEASKCLFHPEDMTHTNEYGSVFFARIIAAGLQKILPDGSDMINDQ